MACFFERGLAQPQEDDRRLFLGLEPDKQHGGCRFEVVVGHIEEATGDVRTQERELFVGVHAGAEVDVVRAERHPRELRVGVGVLDGQAASDEHADTGAVPSCCETRGGSAQRLGPRRRNEFAVAVANQRRVEPVGRGGVAEGPPALVAVPLLVNLRIDAGQAPQHLAATVVVALLAARGAVLADTRR